MIHVMSKSVSTSLNALPVRYNDMSSEVNCVSSSISRRAANSGVESVFSMEPEQTAHFRLGGR